jgi:hypothetical protein
MAGERPSAGGVGDWVWGRWAEGLGGEGTNEQLSVRRRLFLRSMRFGP